MKINIKGKIQRGKRELPIVNPTIVEGHNGGVIIGDSGTISVATLRADDLRRVSLKSKEEFLGVTFPKMELLVLAKQDSFDQVRDRDIFQSYADKFNISRTEAKAKIYKGALHGNDLTEWFLNEGRKGFIESRARIQKALINLLHGFYGFRMPDGIIIIPRRDDREILEQRLNEIRLNHRVLADYKPKIINGYTLYDAIYGSPKKHTVKRRIRWSL